MCLKKMGRNHTKTVECKYGIANIVTVMIYIAGEPEYSIYTLLPI